MQRHLEKARLSSARDEPEVSDVEASFAFCPRESDSSRIKRRSRAISHPSESDTSKEADQNGGALSPRSRRIYGSAWHIVPRIHKSLDAVRLAPASARDYSRAALNHHRRRYAPRAAIAPGLPCGLAFTTGLRNVGKSRRRAITRQTELIGRADSIAGSNSYSVIKMAAAPLRVAPAASE